MGKPRVWQLNEAKARFGELFRRVRSEGPQRVVKQGGEAVVIMSAEQYDRTGELARRPESLLDFFQSAPRRSRLDLSRKRDRSRTIKW
jgi:prevent-host-death family protein